MGFHYFFTLMDLIVYIDSLTYKNTYYGRVIEIIGDVAEPVVDSLQEWGSDAVEYLKGHAPQYLRYAVYALKSLHL